jgi:hypothetical protein
MIGDLQEPDVLPVKLKTVKAWLKKYHNENVKNRKKWPAVYSLFQRVMTRLLKLAFFSFSTTFSGC